VPDFEDAPPRSRAVSAAWTIASDCRHREPVPVVMIDDNTATGARKNDGI